METVNKIHLLVIGGTGFIGHHLLLAAQRENMQLTSVSLNPPSKNRFVDRVRYLHFDISDRMQVKKNLNTDFDYVVNLGGYINHQLFNEGGRSLIENHFNALQNLLEFLPRSKLKRFVQIGSSDEYGSSLAPQDGDIREQAISPYALAKVACTHFLQMLHRTENFPAVILRLFLTYGPGQDSSRFLPQIIYGCLDNSEFPTTTGEQLRDFCYVKDTVRAILKALDVSNVEGEIFNIASGEPVSIRTMIDKVCGIIGNGKPQYGELNYRPGENMALYANLEKTEKYLDWKTKTSLEEGLKKTIEWFKNN
mgnify:CR=1 FL=1